MSSTRRNHIPRTDLNQARLTDQALAQLINRRFHEFLKSYSLYNQPSGNTHEKNIQLDPPKNKSPQAC